jgi:hypothetical protein
MLRWMWSRLGGRRVVNDKSGLTIKVYENDGTTVMSTNAYTTSSTTDDVAKGA